MLALSIIEYGQRTGAYREDDAVRVRFCIDALLSTSSQSYFNKELDLPYGVFYNGWITYVLKAFLACPLSDDNNNSEYKSSYDKLILELGSAIENSEYLLESHYDGVWPADNLVAIAALPDTAVYLKHKWLERIYSTSSSKDGLICHEGSDKESIRGSSQALINYFLGLNGEVLMQEYEQLFLNNILAVQLVREFPLGTESYFDIDSGPVILGYGSVATIMNVKTQKHNNGRYKSTWALLNLMGLPVNLFGRKYYLAKQELMYDLFMLWVGV